MTRPPVTPSPTPARPVTGFEHHLRFTTTAPFDEDWVRRLPEVSDVARDGAEVTVSGDERMLFSVIALLAAHDIVPTHLQVDQ